MTTPAAPPPGTSFVERSAPLLVASDLDGTLLDTSGSRVSERNAAALRRAAAAGAKVVIATGRPIWWLDPVIDAGFTGIAVCMNGAVVYDIAAGQVLSFDLISAAAMHAFVAALSRETDDFAVAVERLGMTIEECWAEPDYHSPWGDGFFQITDRASLLAEPAAKMLVRGGGGDSKTLAKAARAAEVADVAVTYSSNDGLLEVAAAGVNKGSALAKLAADWGIDSTEVIAFGDMPNDLEMLDWAGHGVAMGNAHPDVVAIANEIAMEHHEDGVAVVLERWF